ncbi:hypothetical protein GCM10007063_01980 [Lentibacillus kapialis]|uniref:DUF1934 domain-containing protein n=1 Tax=Lentibacillus kapialis TaxID=340214 RepID=A0A917PLT7_9BACI|nr:DUF1934 domain-containing protein [Lentibacillus kapialis]GGJ83078.1 hypothetical protein GCM10007063_01980 [Lentibacillus kapialis]
MEKRPKQVAVELKTAIEDNGQKEYNTVRESGQLYQQTNMDVLTYTETAGDGSQISNMITIHANKASVKRTGPVQMHQTFHEQKLSENVFQHPHGNIHMETFTDSIDYRPLTARQNGVLAIDYTVRLNGQEEREHELTLTIRPKEGSQ